jgi:hypothetical protein
VIILIMLLRAVVAFSQLTSSSDFTIIALPDTQNESQYNPQMFYSQTRWIVDNRARLNIKAVVGLGDIVNDGASTTQQSNADAAIRTLDNANIPYLLAIGNHDYNRANTGAAARSASGFNHWWGPQRYSGYSYYKGNFPSGSNENFYGILTLGGTNYLFLILEYVPRSAALSWAASVINANPSDAVLVVTHSNMYIDGTRVDRCDTNDLNRDNDGDEAWSKFTKKFPQIRLVLSGHITASPHASRRADLGDNGNLVNQLLSNYQTVNLGAGWLRILTFHPLSNTISVSTFSPFLNRSMTDSANQFTISILSKGIPASSTGNLSGRVRGDRSGNIYNCRKISGAKVTTSIGSKLTDSNGHYGFIGLVPNTYTINVSAPGWSTAAASSKVNGTFTTDLNIFMEPIVGSASGKVANSSGVAIAGATVKFVGGTIPTSVTTKTNSTGTFSVSPLSVGTYQVTASGSGLSQSKSASVTAGTITTIQFRL